jgi:hypothetical protein
MSFHVQEPYEVWLRVTPTVQGGDAFAVELLDEKGNEDSGRFAPDASRRFGRGQATWGELLDRYVKVDAAEDELIAFGKDLFKSLIEESGLGKAWHGLQGAAGARPLRMTVEFGNRTEAVAARPLELLHLHAPPEGDV